MIARCTPEGGGSVDAVELMCVKRTYTKGLQAAYKEIRAKGPTKGTVRVSRQRGTRIKGFYCCSIIAVVRVLCQNTGRNAGGWTRDFNSLATRVMSDVLPVFTRSPSGDRVDPVFARSSPPPQ